MMNAPFLARLGRHRPSPVAPRQQQPEPGAAGLGGLKLPRRQGQGKRYGIWVLWIQWMSYGDFSWTGIFHGDLMDWLVPS